MEHTTTFSGNQNIISINSQLNDHNSSLQVFYHHIYEYKKGLRNLVLFTGAAKFKEKIKQRLENDNIDFVIDHVDQEKINVYFGAFHCVEVIKTFSTLKLNEISLEQDFILGIMLGYDRTQQCKRYLDRRELVKKVKEV